MVWLAISYVNLAALQAATCCFGRDASRRGQLERLSYLELCQLMRACRTHSNQCWHVFLVVEGIHWFFPGHLR